MAIKRRKQKSVTLHKVVLKKIKMEDIPLNEETLDTRVSQMTGPEFELYMVNLGPKAWKEATDNMSLDHVKKLMLMIMCRNELLVPFSAYITLYQNDPRPCQHLYDLLFGGALQQIAIDHNDPKVAYMCLVSKQCDENNIYPILPVLKHNRHYFCLNKNLVKDTDSLKLTKRLDLTGWSSEKLYYAKLTSAMVCAKLQRWSECFAHSMSALDCFRPGFDHIHDVYYYMALSGNNMSVPSSWCCAVLEEASQFSFSIDHLWQRLIVFQGILIHNGHFALEKEMFDSSSNMFVHSTIHIQTFITQHLVGLLAQIENILAFQYARQKFHEDCNCNKEPILEYSFEECQRLIAKVDSLASKLRVPGRKEYFRGYVYLYSTMMQVHKHSPSVLSVNQFSLAVTFFDVAKQYMQESDPYYLDLYLMSSFLKRKFVTIGYITKHFAEKEMSKYSVGAKNFMFRVMVITMYWENKFQPFPLLALCTQARDMDMQVTNGHSYRNPLLTACVKCCASSSTFYHKNSQTNEDYPPIKIPKDTEVWRFWTKASTAKNFTQLPKYIPKHLPPAVSSTAETLLKKTKLGEQIYAFGFQICEHYTML
jgi:hypothetical protein